VSRLRFYKTGFYELDRDPALQPPFWGRGWHVQFRRLTTTRGPKGRERPNVANMHHLQVALSGGPGPRGTYTTVYAPEIVVVATNREVAERAVQWIATAFTVYDMSNGAEDHHALPDLGCDLEGLDPREYQYFLGRHVGTSGYCEAAWLAARSSHRTKWKLALAKLAISYRICCINWMDTHPRYGTRHGVSSDPFHWAMFAQAIVAAYSAIEELGLEVRASSEKPSFINRKWNPPVLEELIDRLLGSGISQTWRHPWLIRNSPTRIERRRPNPAGSTTEWAQRWVRDRYVSPPDAILRASYIRSRVGAHASSDVTRSLTIYDVCNIQMLARALLLRAVGLQARLEEAHPDER